MKLEIKVDKEITDFCNLNNLDLLTFIHDCIEKGYVQNKWGNPPISSIKNNPITIVAGEDIITQKKSEPVTQIPMNDLYNEN